MVNADVECGDFRLSSFFSMMAGRPKSEATTTEAVKRELPTERPLKYLKSTGSF